MKNLLICLIVYFDYNYYISSILILQNFSENWILLLLSKFATVLSLEVYCHVCSAKCTNQSYLYNAVH